MTSSNETGTVTQGHVTKPDPLAVAEHQRDRAIEAHDRAMHRVAQLESELQDAKKRHRTHVANLIAAKVIEMESLVEALRPFAQAWLYRQPSFASSGKAYERRLERALGGFYSMSSFEPDGERFVLTGHHLRDCHEALALVEGNPLEQMVRPILDHYRALHDGLSDMIEDGRLTESDVPDDYHWLVEKMTALAGMDPS